MSQAEDFGKNSLVKNWVKSLAQRVEEAEERGLKILLDIGGRKTLYMCQFCNKNKTDGLKSHKGFIWCGCKLKGI